MRVISLSCNGEKLLYRRKKPFADREPILRFQAPAKVRLAHAVGASDDSQGGAHM